MMRSRSAGPDRPPSAWSAPRLNIWRRAAGWLVTRRALLDELVNVERLARDRLIALCASEAARADLERQLEEQREATAFWEQVR